MTVVLVLNALSASPVWAHPGRARQPHDLLRSWLTDPGIVVLLIPPLALYCVGLVRSRRSSRNGRARVAPAALGWLFLVIALVSPLHALSSVLLSAHMVQHELLMVVAAPLLVLGRPTPVMLRALGPRARSAGTVLLRSLSATIGTPGIAAVLHAGALWLWHVPRVYDLAVRVPAVHALQHASFVLTALLFWWAVLERGERRGAALAVLFATTLHTTILAALLTFAPSPLYSVYRSATVWTADPLGDQQLAGLIMWMPGGLSYLIAALFLVARSLRGVGRRDAWRENAAGASMIVSEGGTMNTAPGEGASA